MEHVSFSDQAPVPTRDNVINGLPVAPRATRDNDVPRFAYRHTASGGFCSVCGGVWPCARGSADEYQHRPSHRA